MIRHSDHRKWHNMTSWPQYCVTIQHHQSFLLVLFCYCPVTFLSNRFSLTQHSALVVSFLTSAWCIASSNLGRLPQSHSLRTSLTEDYKHALVAESFTVISNSLIQRSKIKIRKICLTASKKWERQPTNQRQTKPKPRFLQNFSKLRKWVKILK